ncbi:LacI family DNA-binding transcriptional regulator [Fictibacillus phosphorivorans]|uniref:LacI family DNA-binding transcriptional regulator n=1 Tax=Fictibacillus phosphorivorans TaxID=1221500 RepID=UPI00203DCCDB|nr:LacI family DNA-binding transcriptional regulator [Fictibacillus phosphorivorans]MCM3719018.1 LacI family DNA-binding transcriptional regulator [Fictibacillus phosphorivorans]MCM3776640.1 LacI family DNA-binding transcriptional regulator [Fictibacillus phosphorivorans]
MSKSQIPRVTIKDVALQAGVSKTTVSRYLAGNYNELAPKTKKRIEDTIAALNYRPNVMARGLKRNTSHLIGMVVADITNPYTTAIIRGAEDICNQNGYNLLVCNTDNDPQKESDYISMLQAHRIDGLIINTTGRNNEALKSLALENIPVVLVDRKVKGLDFDMIGVDNHSAVKEAMHHLIDQDFERIAFFTEPIEGVSSRKERSAAFEQSLRKHNHASWEEIYEVDLAKEDELMTKLSHFLESSKNQSKAIFAANGVVLLQIVVAIQNLKLSIPDDIALLGFDDPEWAIAVGTGISAIAQPTYEIGVAAMEKILSKVKGSNMLPQTIAFTAKLNIRGSTQK